MLNQRHLLDVTRVDTAGTRTRPPGIAQTGFQYTPVASITTCVTPSAASQSRSVKQPRDRRRELRHVLLARATLARHPHARGDLLLVHIQRRRDARLPSPSDLLERDRQDRRPGASEN